MERCCRQTSEPPGTAARRAEAFPWPAISTPALPADPPPARPPPEGTPIRPEPSSTCGAPNTACLIHGLWWTTSMLGLPPLPATFTSRLVELQHCQPRPHRPGPVPPQWCASIVWVSTCKNCGEKVYKTSETWKHDLSRPVSPRAARGVVAGRRDARQRRGEGTAETGTSGRGGRGGGR